MRSIQLQLTSKCNQKCMFCRKYNWPFKEMSLKTVSKVLIENPEATYVFSGGDPLSYTNIAGLNVLLDHAKVKYHVLTNLSYSLDLEQRKFLLNAERIDVSLDTVEESEYKVIRGKHADFNQLMSNVEELNGLVPIKFNTVITVRHTARSVANIIKYAVEYDIPVRLNYVHTHLKLSAAMRMTYKNLGLFIEPEQLKKYTNLDTLNEDLEVPAACYVKHCHMVVDEDGRQYTCCVAIDDNGSVRKTSASIGDGVTKESLSLEYQKYDYCKNCNSRYIKANKRLLGLEDDTKIYL